MKPPESPKYSDKEMGFWAKALMEMCNESLPSDMRVAIVIVDGSDMVKNKRFRTRMCTNMGRKLTEKVFHAMGRDLDRVLPVKKHYSMRLDPGRIGFK